MTWGLQKVEICMKLQIVKCSIDRAVTILNLREKPCGSVVIIPHSLKEWKQ